MCKALEFEGGSAADLVRISQQHLKRDDNVLPAEALLSGFSVQFRCGTTVYAAHHLVKPAMRNIFTT